MGKRYTVCKLQTKFPNDIEDRFEKKLKSKKYNKS